MTGNAAHRIGELNEQPLHAGLKSWYAQPGDRLEVSLDGFVVDIFREECLIEIQTGSFSNIKKKMHQLTANYPLTLVYPIAAEKWLYKLAKEEGEEDRRRKSPKRGRVEEVFFELVSFPELLVEENFTLEVALIQEEEVRRFSGRKMWWKNGWERVERRLIEVVRILSFSTPGDLGKLLPEDLPPEFTTRDLAGSLDSSRSLAQKMAYCLRRVGEIEKVGNRGRSYLYTRT